jgi:hypothetical protein
MPRTGAMALRRTKAQWAESRAGRQVAAARTDLAAAWQAVPSIERDLTAWRALEFPDKP